MIVFTIKLITTRHNVQHKEVANAIGQAISTCELPPQAKHLTVEHPRTSKFYMLPKIHKAGNPGRPIVSACNCPSSNISAYLDSVMAPLVRQLSSYVKDTNHALQILESFTFSGPNRYLFTMDIKSLYTIIPNNDGLQASSTTSIYVHYSNHQQTRSFNLLNLFSN